LVSDEAQQPVSETDSLEMPESSHVHQAIKFPGPGSLNHGFVFRVGSQYYLRPEGEHIRAYITSPRDKFGG
jgi:hypothetical protein